MKSLVPRDFLVVVAELNLYKDYDMLDGSALVGRLRMFECTGGASCMM